MRRGSVLRPRTIHTAIPSSRDQLSSSGNHSSETKKTAIAREATWECSPWDMTTDGDLLESPHLPMNRIHSPLMKRKQSTSPPKQTETFPEPEESLSIRHSFLLRPQQVKLAKDSASLHQNPDVDSQTNNTQQPSFSLPQRRTTLHDLRATAHANNSAATIAIQSNNSNSKQPNNNNNNNQPQHSLNLFGYLNTDININQRRILGSSAAAMKYTTPQRITRPNTSSQSSAGEVNISQLISSQQSGFASRNSMFTSQENLPTTSISATQSSAQKQTTNQSPPYSNVSPPIVAQQHQPHHLFLSEDDITSSFVPLFCGNPKRSSSNNSNTNIKSNNNRSQSVQISQNLQKIIRKIHLLEQKQQQQQQLLQQQNKFQRKFFKPRLAATASSVNTSTTIDNSPVIQPQNQTRTSIDPQPTIASDQKPHKQPLIYLRRMPHNSNTIHYKNSSVNSSVSIRAPQTATLQPTTVATRSQRKFLSDQKPATIPQQVYDKNCDRFYFNSKAAIDLSMYRSKTVSTPYN